MSLFHREELVSFVTHFIAMLLSVAALIVLVVFAIQKASVWHVVSFSFFGASLILLYFFSTLYHAVRFSHPAKNILRKIDHSMIYVLIAGSYTPICLVAIRGGWGWSIFGIIWGFALLGIVLKISKVRIAGYLSVLFYLFMGWLILIAIIPLARVFTDQAIAWLVAGGVFYTLGTIFFGLDKILPRLRIISMHDIFHIFVVAGSASHFWLMFKHVLYI